MHRKAAEALKTSTAMPNTHSRIGNTVGPSPLRRAARVRTGGEHRGGVRRVGGGPPPGHEPVVRRQVADRVRAGGVAGEQEGLAAAAAEVDLAARAAPTRVLHPVRPAEGLEER